MHLEKILDIVRYTHHYDVDTRSLNSYVLYVCDTKGQINAEDIADEFNISHGVSAEILEKFKRTGVAKESSNSYELHREEFLEFYGRIEWLTSEENTRYINTLFEEDGESVDFLFTFPKTDKGKAESTITGEMINLVASTQEHVFVVNPFFDYSGTNVFLNALVNATKGSELTVLTRDIYTGDESNREVIRKIVEAVKDSGNMQNFNLYEFNKDGFPEGSIHAKMIVSDGERAFLGSANITENSQQRAFEAGALIKGDKVSFLEGNIEDFLKSEFVKTVSTQRLVDS